jgi:carbon-monoxide dehydrogenase medium subunit
MDPSGLNVDLHASAEYRAHLIPVLAARAVEQALKG